ncbi:MAG: AAA family ATPase [Chloroflexi bacterium]|nr:AAA family ATPase [Chloroflexota bacterium]
MAQLQDALTKVIDGQGSAWLLGGEGGVGKSRLTNELRINALVNGCLVLRGQGVRDGGGIPYQLWRQSLLILEDLQWTQASLELLPYLLWQLDKVTLLLLGNYRDDEWPDLPQSLPGMQIISLPRLSADNMAELSAAMLGEIGQQPEVLALLQRETEGNAFFAVEVVRALAEEAGRLKVTRIYRLRLKKLKMMTCVTLFYMSYLFTAQLWKHPINCHLKVRLQK